MNSRRWYPTVETLPTGDAIMIGGDDWYFFFFFWDLPFSKSLLSVLIKGEDLSTMTNKTSLCFLKTFGKSHQLSISNSPTFEYFPSRGDEYAFFFTLFPSSDAIIQRPIHVS